MEAYRKILTDYWGFNRFRPLQEEIINSIAEGKDTLALMPTGGGKSLTFQVPALAKPGLCLVITPLIALMRDQVENLKQRKIKAVAIHSGLSGYEIDIALDNCIYGDFKFLYLSPERLSSPLFLKRLESMRVNLLAVDEAHCISQWGYDFRPSYLKIAEIRKLLPGVPVIALTATATPKVAEDIQKNLEFRETNIIRQSFERKNLVYWVHSTEDKVMYLKRLLKQQPGSAIVYVRNRKRTKEIAETLTKEGYRADFYHAGLSVDDRNVKQQNWQVDKTRVMISTNAFGMGIDKPDVRLVVHWELPDSPESYFQEAGRAGRDGKKAFAVLMYHPSDKMSLNQSFRIRFPDVKVIRKVYQALGHFFQLVPGTGKGQVFEFDLRDFSAKFGFHSLVAFHSIKHLEKAGYIELSEELALPARIYFRVNRDDLYKFQIVNTQYDGIIKLLLRLYAGLFSDFVPVNESFVALKAGVKPELIERILTNLHYQGIIYYLKPTTNPRIAFTAERLNEKSLILPIDKYSWMEKEASTRLETMYYYAESEERCRSQILLMYFGEKDPFRCGQCDICKGKNKVSVEELNIIQSKILSELAKSDLNPKELVILIGEEEVITDIAITELMDAKKIKMKAGRFKIS
ncbi:MAG: ATP-dependent DNA helicase RecQ [Bacteroidota bacterium]|nr:ATP-dependent DNA helicase RecQ [Bacteroidota bacterium]